MFRIYYIQIPYEANNLGGKMKLDEIKEIAKYHNVKVGKLKKSDLVRAIQQTEKNEECFDTGNAVICGQNACLWREDCLTL